MTTSRRRPLSPSQRSAPDGNASDASEDACKAIAKRRHAEVHTHDAMTDVLFQYGRKQRDTTRRCTHERLDERSSERQNERSDYSDASGINTAAKQDTGW
jgi:hypothetical protein